MYSGADWYEDALLDASYTQRRAVPAVRTRLAAMSEGTAHTEAMDDLAWIARILRINLLTGRDFTSPSEGSILGPSIDTEKEQDDGPGKTEEVRDRAA